MQLLNQKGFVPVLILLGLVVLIIVGGGAYYLGRLGNQKTRQVVNIPAASFTPQPSTQVGYQQTASDKGTSSTYCPESVVTIPSLKSDQISDPNKIGMSNPKIELAYASKTNLADPTIKANVDADIQHVTNTLKLLPIIGSPLVSLASQDRYGYTFPAVNRESSGTYMKDINQLFLNMDAIDKSNDHLIFHEMAHYLSVRQNSNNLTPYLTQAFSEAALQAENNLLSCIRKYDQNPNIQVSDSLVQKLQSHSQVTWQEIVDAANVYPAQIWQNPQSFLQFRSSTNVDANQVKTRADDELYAEFSAFLIEAQTAGLFDKNYQHPVYRIFAAIKR